MNTKYISNESVSLSFISNTSTLSIPLDNAASGFLSLMLWLRVNKHTLVANDYTIFEVGKFNTVALSRSSYYFGFNFKSTGVYSILAVDCIRYDFSAPSDMTSFEKLERNDTLSMG